MLAKPYSSHTSEWTWPFLLRIYLTLPLRTHRKPLRQWPWHSTETSSYIIFYIEMLMLTQDKQAISIPKIHLGQKNRDMTTSLTSHVGNMNITYMIHVFLLPYFLKILSATYYYQHATYLCQYTIYLSWHAKY